MTRTTSVVICAYTEQRWSQLLTAVASVRAQGVPVAEVRVRAPRLEALYLDTLRPREANDSGTAILRAGMAR